jgi:cytoskeletal protein RodZ
MKSDSVEWRQKRGISLAAIAAATKINSRYLEAIETGRYDRLPGEVYARNYIRQYAKAIDYEEDALIEEYVSTLPPKEPAVAPRPDRVPWLGWAWRAARYLAPVRPALPD